MSARSSIREQIKKDFGVNLPIIGGSGQSIDDPIIIDPNYPDHVNLEYSYVRFVNAGLNRKYKVIRATLLNHNGRNIDQLKLEVEGDSKNYYNYYFDVTNHISKIKK